ncbi:LamB/YcsF family protein [Campylobacter jejuni]|nr:LamB/YcsF family protein [Campylobacter jejuni]EAH4627035.1 LamB/YcsF family protein [Campylobacter jejuni]EAI4569282.1 LamB/YcsF family protein [Campylobacter jejuni]EAJ5494186.1 LamB/YcsF family protein [Campylobacter jejuni]EAK1653096.1 LamB/YcsF family protein [Campylobacter jejuni]
MFKVDLNSDLGESFGAYKMGMDEEILKFVSSVNVACGFHAGDPCVMDKTLNLAKQNGVCIGAHPSYPDLLGFGRRNMQISFEEAKNYALYQLGALFGFAKAKGMKIQHFKAHGALYNMAAIDENLALALCEAVASFDENIIFLGLSNSAMNEAAKKKGLRYANEVFADRAYNDDGTLVSRKLEGTLIHDENLAIKRVIKMIKESKVTSINGKEIDLKADSICVHGDNIKALEFVKKIKENLEKEQIQICALENFI